jgi:hypothetical protein
MEIIRLLLLIKQVFGFKSRRDDIILTAAAGKKQRKLAPLEQYLWR